MRRLLLIGALAMCACKDHGVQPKRTVVADSADQVIIGMATTVSLNGVLQSKVIADSAWIYQARGVDDLKRMTVTMYDSAGKIISTIKADVGIYRVREQHLDARGHVVATSSEGKVLKTEHLVFDSPRNLITSDTAFTSTSPKGNVSGAHFEADPGFKNVQINKMKGMEKGGARGKAKGILLPGQRGGGLE